MPHHCSGTQMNKGLAYLDPLDRGRTSDLPNIKLTVEDFFQIMSLENDPLTFLKGCSLNTKLGFRIGSLSDAIASREQGLHALKYAKSLSFTGLLHSRHLDMRYVCGMEVLLAM